MQHKIWIRRSVLDYIFLDGASHLPNETGGILIGYRASDTELVVTDIIGPGKKAAHGKSSFKPDQKFHEKEVARKYIESGYTETYLGDWHTHPYSVPYLSGKDKETIKKIASSTAARLSNPIMLIASPPNTAYNVWVFSPSGLTEKHTFMEGDIVAY